MFTSLLLLKFRTRSVMESHNANLGGLPTQLASMNFVLKVTLKMVLLLVTLSKHKDYTAMVASLKKLGAQRSTWSYIAVRMFDEYAQVNRPTLSQQADRSSRLNKLRGI